MLRNGYMFQNPITSTQPPWVPPATTSIKGPACDLPWFPFRFQQKRYAGLKPSTWEIWDIVTAHCHCSSLVVVLDSSGWDSGYRLSWHQKITPKIKPQRGQKNALTTKEWWPVSTLAQPTSRIWSGPPSARHPRKLHLIISSRRSDGDIHLCR
jgi:hypothetical protein